MRARTRWAVRTALLSAMVLIAWRSALAQGAPTVPAPSIPAAMGHFYRGDAAGAAKIFEGVTAATPGNANAWRLLALCYRQTGELDRAMDAYDKAIALEPNAPAAIFDLAGVYALERKSDSAFALLARAKATHNYDMTQLEVDSAYASLRHDPRYARLLPTAKDFAAPFVEDVKVIREIDGDSTGDQFGWIARGIGDVDHDGVVDFVTSAPTKYVGGANAGRVYAYSSKSGKLLWSVDGKAGEQLGTGVESAGDVDGDGTQDVIAGAPYSGRAYIYSGTDGHVLFTLKAENDSDAFGLHVSTAGDVDHDGHSDFIVGAPSNAAGGTGAGRAYVYSGKDGHVLLTLTGERAGDAFGSTVAGYADAKRSFVVVGAPSAGSGSVGRTYVYEGLSKKPKFIIESDATGRALGAMFISVVGDVNGDGVPDVYASDYTNGAKGPSTGRIYVHSGRMGSGSSRSPAIRQGKDSGSGRPPRAMSITTVAPIWSWAHGSTPARPHRGDASISTPDATGTCSRRTPIAFRATPSASTLSASVMWMATAVSTSC